MYKTINPINIVTNQPGARFEYPTPKVCPICNTGIDARVLSSFYIQNEYLACDVFILFFVTVVNPASWAFIIVLIHQPKTAYFKCT